MKLVIDSREPEKFYTEIKNNLNQEINIEIVRDNLDVGDFHIYKNKVIIPQNKQDVKYLQCDVPIYYHMVDQFIHYNKLVYFMMLNIMQSYLIMFQTLVMLL